MAVSMNLALGFVTFLGLFLFAVLVFFMAVVGVAGVASVAIEFLHCLNLLFDVAAALAAGLFDFLPEKLLLIFFLCFLINCAALKSSLGLLCLDASNKVEMKGFNLSLNFSIRWSSGVLACCHSLNIQ